MGHVLIVPKNHVEFFHQLIDTDIIDMRNVLSALYKGFQEKYNATGYNLFTNNGKKAYQHVSHVHWHVFIRFDDEEYYPYDVLNGKIQRENISSNDEE